MTIAHWQTTHCISTTEAVHGRLLIHYRKTCMTSQHGHDPDEMMIVAPAAITMSHGL